MSRLLRSPLARDISAVLAVKITLIVLAGIFLFGKDQRPSVNPDRVAQHMFGPPPSSAR